VRLALQFFRLLYQFIVNFQQLFVLHSVPFTLKSHPLHFLLPPIPFLFGSELQLCYLSLALSDLAVQAFLENGYFFGVNLVENLFVFFQDDYLLLHHFDSQLVLFLEVALEVVELSLQLSFLFDIAFKFSLESVYDVPCVLFGDF
jgi:hypothetical protein